MTRRRVQRPGCEVCAERRRQEERADRQWRDLSDQRPAAGTVTAAPEVDFGPLRGPFMILLGLLVLLFLQLRDIGAHVIDDDEDEEEASVGEG